MYLSLGRTVLGGGRVENCEKGREWMAHFKQDPPILPSFSSSSHENAFFFIFQFIFNDQELMKRSYVLFCTLLEVFLAQRESQSPNRPHK